MTPIWTFNRETGLEVSRTEKKVRFIPLTVHEALRIHELNIQLFDDQWKPIPDYDTAKAIAHFRRIGNQYGALKEVAKLLSIDKPQAIFDEVIKVEKKKPESAKAPAKKKITCGARFMELIMMNKHTDQEIFDIVKNEFDLTDNKNGYVRWYRKHLHTQGKNPPPSLGEIPRGRKSNKASVQTSESMDRNKRKMQQPKSPVVERLRSKGSKTSPKLAR